VPLISINVCLKELGTPMFSELIFTTAVFC
jgi:hypothetical protein